MASAWQTREHLASPTPWLPLKHRGTLLSTHAQHAPWEEHPGGVLHQRSKADLGHRAGGRRQAVAGRLVFWRRRRVGGVLAALVALVVDPGLRPRFFRVLPMCCSFRAR